MNKFGLKHVILLLSLLLCFLPAVVYAGNSLSGSFTVAGNRIIDLAVSNPTYTSLTLTWTSPKSSPPNWGPATKYDIRFSLSPINTEAEWQASTQLANPPIPGPPGSPETLIVIGLNPCTTYYFAIKAADGSGTWTPLSNSPSGKTLCSSGGGGSIPPVYVACPVTLTADMEGTVATVRTTRDGVLCTTCLAEDAANKYTLEIDKDAKVTLADNKVPMLLTFRESADMPPAPENTVIVSPAYKFNAYPTLYETTPSPITISPPARLLFSYQPDELPQNATEVFIANYDTEEGWLPLSPVPGAVAEIGKAHGLLAHFSLFALLARLQEPAPAKFEVSNLTIGPSQIQLNQEVTISLNVANTGGKSGDCNLELKVDGTIKSTTQVTIAPGASQTVNLTLTGNTEGKHQIEIAGLSGEFEVIKSAVPSVINWWFIGSITGIILVLAIWAIIGWRWLKDRKKAAPATIASADASTDAPADTPDE